LSLIRSIKEYSSFIINLISKQTYKRIQAIQNQFMGAIFRVSPNLPTTEIFKIAKIIEIKERTNELNTNYLINAINNNNPLIEDLIKESIRGQSQSKKR
jgi:hypothetical protein